MTCLVTGCALILRSEPDTHLWGDMHAVSAGTLIFNAVLDPNSGEALRITRPIDERVRSYFVAPYAEVFERRGVLIFDALEAGWNRALGDYLELDQRERYV
ncbi:MAG TPA: hypothetical protein PKV98_07845 [Burkholderiaceae bacterium]|nr:hypothetical protein [Burkholderiaceae bacterium]